jgi:hypothetical protein
MPDLSQFAMPPNLTTAVLAAVSDIADRQLGVVRRRDLLGAGLTDSQADRCLLVRRWQDVGADVLVLHNGPLTSRQEWAVAVLAGGSLCGLAARTAAEAAGLLGWESKRVEVVVPRGTTYPVLRGIAPKVHESRRFNSMDLADVWPPRVRIERALVDAAAWSAKPRAACGVLAAGVQQRLTVAERLLVELDRAGAVRHRRVMRSALWDIAGGAHAVSEIAFIRFCRRHGLPRPAHQVVRRDPNGRRRYLDATLIGPNGAVVRVEIDGALHLLVRTYWDDMARGNEMSIGRETVLRFPSVVIYDDDPVALDQLHRALDLLGRSARLPARGS